MLPLSLKLRNFLSYRENVPTLHLEDVHLACLCGANGHGKSALLDAMTWVLWGKARGQRHEQLLHQGSQEMLVEMEFEARGQRYRVTRRFSYARRQGASSLELAVASGDDYRAITGDTIAKTEAFIGQLIGMDYVTFVNSAFLLQGRADLFTMSAPAKRKEVLARVLDLGLYDRLEERAKDHARELQSRLAAVRPVLERLEQQASWRHELAQSLEQTVQELASSQSAYGGLEERLALLRDHLARLERLQHEAQEMAIQAQRAESRRQEAGDEGDSLRRRLAAWHDVIQQAPQTDAGYEALTSARQRLLGLQVTARHYYEIEQQLLPLQQRIAQARAALESEITVQERQLLQELEPRAQALPALAEALAQADGLLEALPSKEAEIALLAERQQSAALQARRLEDDNTRIAGAGRDTRAKLDLLDHSHPDGSRCPLCDTPLEPDAKARIQQTFHQEIQAYQRQYREQASQVKVMDQEAASLQAQMAQLQRELDVTRQQLVTQRAQVSAQHDQALQAQGRLGEARTGLTNASQTLETGRYAQEEQAQAAGLRQRLEAMAFHLDDLAKAEQDVQRLESWEGAHRRLEEARARMPEDEALLAKAEGRKGEAVEELARLSERQATLQRDVADVPVYQARLRELEVEQLALTRQRDQLQERSAVLTYQLAEAEQAAQDLQNRRAEQQALVQQSGAYTDLAQAFGKGGVQALLIEAAIPRLEEETNLLLRRMTDGRMSIKIETQRDRRGPAGRDGSVETLDILIADELGTRSYEMFSGGESFRVDFALRIALSKLLAWRAGAPLPTLFIDEGFGTQDAEGRDRILDVIRSIEPDFQRILVVTHLDEIKEAFPVRIEVTRSAAAGSTFAVA